MKLKLGVTDIPYARSYAPVTARGRASASSGGAPSSTTTGDVAEILEARYGVMQRFYDLHGQEIADDVTEALRVKLENLLMGAPVDTSTILPEGSLSKLEEKFRKMLDNRELDGRVPGVPTQASLQGVSHRLTHPYARRDARASFIDTGGYQASFRAWVEES